jgi:ankyrin repeat protein
MSLPTRLTCGLRGRPPPPRAGGRAARAHRRALTAPPPPPHALWPPWPQGTTPASPTPADSADEDDADAALAAAVAAAAAAAKQQQQQQQPSPPGPPGSPPSSSSSSPLALAWWAATVAVAAATAAHTPWTLAFTGDWTAFYSLHSPSAWLELLLSGLWAAETVAARVAAPVADSTLDDAAVSAATLGTAAPAGDRAGLAGTVTDVLASVPLDFLVVAAAGGPSALPPTTLPALALLRLAALLRLHRLRAAFAFLELNESVDILAATIARNTALVAFGAHATACGFAYLAHGGLGALSPDALVGADADYFSSLPVAEAYVYALWWGLTSLTAGAEFGNGSPTTPSATAAAAARSGLFLLFNATVLSYILGTTTLLLVRGDERTGRYRDQSARLREFARTHAVPPDLSSSMAQHLRLHFANEEADDESLLAIYPTSLRRRVLRHLYGRRLREAYLFAGTPRAFRDALLAEARLELYLPGVEILGAGDVAGEVCLLVQGTAEAVAGRGKGGPLSPTPRLLQAGDLFGELAFFTEEPQVEAVRSLTVCRVALLPRSAMDALLRAFPAAARAVFANLGAHAEELLAAQFPAGPARDSAAAASATADPVAALPPGLSPPQRAALGDLLRVRSAATALAARFDEERTTAWLYAAARGAVPVLRTMLAEGTNVDAADFDARTALMLAAANGHVDAVALLLAAGADANRVDNFGLCALSEACRYAHDAVIDRLVGAGAALATRPSRSPTSPGADRSASRPILDAAKLCEAVHAGDAPLLRRFIRSGANVDVADYDRRTALHVAAAEGAAVMARLLVEEGGASVNVRDRWGATPLDEAARVGAAPVLAYLQSVGGVSGKSEEAREAELSA